MAETVKLSISEYIEQENYVKQVLEPWGVGLAEVNRLLVKADTLVDSYGASWELSFPYKDKGEEMYELQSYITTVLVSFEVLYEEIAGMVDRTLQLDITEALSNIASVRIDNYKTNVKGSHIAEYTLQGSDAAIYDNQARSMQDLAQEQYGEVSFMDLMKTSLSRQMLEKEYADFREGFQVENSEENYINFIQLRYRSSEFYYRTLGEKIVGALETTLFILLVAGIVLPGTFLAALSGGTLSAINAYRALTGKDIDGRVLREEERKAAIQGLTMEITLALVSFGVSKYVSSFDDVHMVTKGANLKGYDYLDDQLGPLKDKVKINAYESAESVNDFWKSKKYTEPPYKPGTVVQNMELLDDTTFVRVYNGTDTGMYGGWVMNAEDIAGLTPKEIQLKYALPYEPIYVAEVKISAGNSVNMGIANELFGYPGGGIQFDLKGQQIGEFTELGKITGWGK